MESILLVAHVLVVASFKSSCRLVRFHIYEKKNFQCVPTNSVVAGLGGPE